MPAGARSLRGCLGEVNVQVKALQVGLQVACMLESERRTGGELFCFFGFVNSCVELEAVAPSLAETKR